jgi:glycosyltransferase involved in cell wall biosynthesis
MTDSQGRLRPLFCFSHLRWEFVFQRPQHIMSRFARTRPVTFWEEPKMHAGNDALEIRFIEGVRVVTPWLQVDALRPAAGTLRLMLDELLGAASTKVLFWYYTPMAMQFTEHRDVPRVYDCMDELSAFKDAPEELPLCERRLLDRCEVVFTGGRSLYDAKRRMHRNVHCFPSAVDVEHFRPARRPEPADLRELPHPRAGFYGVIDERFDARWLDDVAALLPDWHFILVGPIVKIDPVTLPQRPNIHYLGMRTYGELPAYLEHWDVALLPFACNAATRFVSPTKTLEYLAAFVPVVSTPIADVISPYGEEGLVRVVTTPCEAASAIRTARTDALSPVWLANVRGTIARHSWDATVTEINRLLDVSDSETEMTA